MNRLINYLSIDFNYKIYSSFFRVFIYGFLIIELIYNSSFIHLYFSQFNEYYTKINPNKLTFIIENYLIFYIIYFIVLILGVLGIGKNLTSLLIWILFLIHLKIFPYGIWIEDILKLNLLFMCFINSYSYFTLYKNQNSKTSQNANLISNLGVYCIIFHTCLIYTLNGLHKFSAEFWTSGQAIYFASKEYHYSIFTLHKQLFTNLWISKYLGYIVIFQQLFFIPLVFTKRTKKLVLILASLIHLTIGIVFLLLKFQLMIISFYGFFFTDNQILKQLKIKN